MSNRLAAAADIRPNKEYHYMVRSKADRRDDSEPIAGPRQCRRPGRGRACTAPAP